MCQCHESTAKNHVLPGLGFHYRKIKLRNTCTIAKNMLTRAQEPEPRCQKSGACIHGVCVLFVQRMQTPQKVVQFVFSERSIY